MVLLGGLKGRQEVLMIADYQVPNGDPAGPTGDLGLIPIDDLASLVGVIVLIVEVAREGLRAPIEVSPEPPLDHALEHGLRRDCGIELVLRMPLAGKLIDQAKLLVGSGVVIPPRRLNVAAPVVGLTRFRVLLPILHPLALAVLLD